MNKLTTQQKQERDILWKKIEMLLMITDKDKKNNKKTKNKKL